MRTRLLVVLFVGCVLIAAAVIVWTRSTSEQADEDGGHVGRADPRGLAWSRAGADDFEMGTDLTVVTWVQARGFVGLGTSEGAGVAWRSGDGSSWERVETEVFQPASQPAGVDASGQTVVAAGVVDETMPVAWVSLDSGASWTSPKLPGVPLGRARGVAVSPDLVRGAVIGGATLGEARQAAVWWSPDGSEWNLVEDDDLQAQGADLAILDVTSTEAGFVAVGTENDRVAAVWVSPNGRDWERIGSEAFADTTDLSMWSVASRPGEGVVAVGHSLGERIEPAVWFSLDGRAWERVPLDSAGERSMWGVTASSRGWVAVGSAQADTRAALWYSVDGRDWRQYEEVDVGSDVYFVALYSVAASDVGFVAVGGETRSDPPQSRALVLSTS